MIIRKTIAYGLALLALLFVIGVLHCGPALTPAEQAGVAIDGMQMSACAASAHLCKEAAGDGGDLAPCWAHFDACMSAHGFTDGGK